MQCPRKGYLLKAMKRTKRDIDKLARALKHDKSKREVFAQLRENPEKGCKKLWRALRRLERGIDWSGPLDTTALDDIEESFGVIQVKFTTLQSIYLGLEIPPAVREYG